MTATISVSPSTPAAPAAPAPVVSVSADLAKAYADALAEAKAEVAAVEAALKGDEAKAGTWISKHEPTVVGIGLAILILVLKFLV